MVPTSNFVDKYGSKIFSNNLLITEKSVIGLYDEQYEGSLPFLCIQTTLPSPIKEGTYCWITIIWYNNVRCSSSFVVPYKRCSDNKPSGPGDFPHFSDLVLIKTEDGEKQTGFLYGFNWEKCLYNNSR